MFNSHGSSPRKSSARRIQAEGGATTKTMLPLGLPGVELRRVQVAHETILRKAKLSIARVLD